MTKTDTNKFSIKIPVSAKTESLRNNKNSILKNHCSNCATPLKTTIRKGILCPNCETVTYIE